MLDLLLIMTMKLLNMMMTGNEGTSDHDDTADTGDNFNDRIKQTFSWLCPRTSATTPSSAADATD